jgi:uncharacterized SAM-binding protein YcdF (DUF218 family)
LPPLADGVRAAAELALTWLAAPDPRPAAPVDAIVGFGVFDLGLARFCGELLLAGLAPRIVFTGGIGAGTGSLGGPEADMWRAELRRVYPQIGDDRVVLENRSTNTAENIGFTAALLARDHPSLAFGTGIRSAVFTASPSRLRRVRLTWRQLQPAIQAAGLVPPHTLDGERALYAHHGTDYLAHLAGELDRIRDYPARGWIAPEALPAEISAARAVLRAAAPPSRT